uniref:Uncharacterized protein n=1 Tax=Romanomermis culicivorax TaxID=13658 RepID=A0A915HTH1_ROMCU
MNGGDIYNLYFSIEGRLRGLQAFFMTTDIEAWASVFWEEASVDFKTWWKGQQGAEYPARQKPFWAFMKRLRQMF